MCLLRKRVCSYIITVQWINPENLIQLPAASFPALLVFPGMRFIELPPGTGPRSGPYAHPSLVSISRTAAGSCLVFHHAYSSYRDRAVSLEGRPHWVCLVFPCAQIRDMQVGQDPNHMTPPPTLPSFTSADEWCPPASLQVMPTWITSLVFSTISTAWRQCFPYLQRSTLRPHTCPDPHQPVPTPFRIHWWLFSKPVLTTNDVKLWQCSPTSSTFISQSSTMKIPPSPSMTYIFPELFVCLFIISMDLQSTAVLISFDDLIIPDLAKESNYVFATSPSFFIYIPYWKLQSTLTGFPIPSSLCLFFFFSFTGGDPFHFRHRFSLQSILCWTCILNFNIVTLINILLYSYRSFLYLV